MNKKETIAFLSQYCVFKKGWQTVEGEKGEIKRKIEKGTEPPTEQKLPGIGMLIWTTILAGVVISVALAAIWGIWLIVEGLGTPYEDMKSMKFIFWLIELVTQTEADVFLESHSWLGWLIGFAAVGFPLGFIFSLYCVISNRKETRQKNASAQNAFEYAQKHMPEWRHDFEEAEEKSKQLRNQMRAMEHSGVMAERYFTWAGYLLDYLKDGRADTMKEAINLLEDDFYKNTELIERARHHKQMEDIAIAHAAVMQSEAARTREAAERTAAAAEEASFWNQAETFIIANEIDKAKRKK